MNKERWQGILLLVVGGGICAWQIYEVDHTNHFTVWVVGCLPLPVIVLGGLVVLAGLGLLIFGGK